MLVLYAFIPPCLYTYCIPIGAGTAPVLIVNKLRIIRLTG